MADGLAITLARPRVIGALAAQFRDLDLAEEAYDAAVEKLLKSGEEPANVASFLFVAGKRAAIDMLRRRKTQADYAASAAVTEPMADILTLPDAIADERLRLLFICCHPTLALEARAALALRTICGVEAEAIARAFLTKPATIYQRITRAKAKIAKAGIPFELPPRKDWPERVGAVLLTLEAAFGLSYAEGGAGEHSELGEDVERLAAMLVELVPDDPEVLGFAALVALARSREAARIDDDGVMVPLSEQDVTLWDAGRIARAQAWLDAAAAAGRTGRYQLMAAIQLTHARRLWSGKTDWAAIVRLYDALMALAPDDVVAINRAVAFSHLGEPEDALQLLPEAGKNFLPWQAARADLLARAGRYTEARVAYDAALKLASTAAQKTFLQGRRKRL